MPDIALTLTLAHLLILLLILGGSLASRHNPALLALLAALPLFALGMMGGPGRPLWVDALASGLGLAALIPMLRSLAGWQLPAWQAAAVAVLGALLQALGHGSSWPGVVAGCLWGAAALLAWQRNRPLTALRGLPILGLLLVAAGAWANPLHPSLLGPAPLAGITLICTSLLLQRFAEERQRGESLARLDPITGLVNRPSFVALFNKELQRGQRGAQVMTVLAVGADGYRQLLERKGQLAGERLLRHLAELLGNCVRGQDLCARFSGELFCVLLPDTGEDGALRMAQRLRQTVATSTVGPDALRFTVSIGIASSEGETLHPEEVLARAEAAQQRARDAGGDRIECQAATPLDEAQVTQAQVGEAQTIGVQP